MIDGGDVLREQLLGVIDTQIETLQPPEAAEARDRLVGAGESEDDARRAIARVLAGEIFEIARDEREYDEGRYRAALRALPELLYEQG